MHFKKTTFPSIIISPLPFSSSLHRDFSTAFFNSIPISGSLAGSMMSASQTNQLMSLDYNATNSLGTSKPALEPTAVSAKPTEDAANKDRSVLDKACFLLTYTLSPYT